ncbi:MAG: 16S rRNA (uracil(1498)-N(3))-methyltransferase [Candidatus Peregrinibacteria bacterium]|nr:16S rRNA (uracil(1498)-N(3))-methyltransferase [Candidatus Peregrinibacteria bacterium]
MHRFHLPTLNFKGDYLIIEDRRITNQASKVLRMKKGGFFYVFDEKEEWQMQIEDISPKKLIANKIKRIENRADPNLQIALYQAIPKKPALFELVVQKATELGVSEIFPLITERTENRRMSKFDRLQLIALEATEQCGRLKIPTIRHPVSFEGCIDSMPNGFVAYEHEQTHLLSDYAAELKKAKSIQLIIGPEGGLTETEVSLAQSAGIKSFSLGPRILRTETAAIVSLGTIILGS